MQTFMELFEMFGGPMGGDQRNMRGSVDRVSNDEKFNGKKIRFPLGDEDEFDYFSDIADDYNVEIEFKYFKSYDIIGKKSDITKFLKALNYKPREFKEYF